MLGCARSPSQAVGPSRISTEQHNSSLPSDSKEISQPNPIAVGGHHPRIDQLESIVQAPRRFVVERLPQKWKNRLENNKSEDARREEAVRVSQEYLSENDLNDVYIDVRRYEPGEQWARLYANDRIAPIWKYTGGSLSLIGYSLFPGRALHRDNYNPYTTTLSINSTRPIRSLLRAGDAKEYHKHQDWLGTYSAAQFLPVVPLVHQWNVSKDVIGYAQTNDRWALERKLYPYVYGDLAGSAVSETLGFFPVGKGATQIVAPIALRVLGTGAGRLTGFAKAQELEGERETASEIP